MRISWVGRVAWWGAAVCCSSLCAGPVEFGRSELQAAMDARGMTGLRVAIELGAEPPESYHIERAGGNSILIRGGDLRGILYGFLEAAEQLRLTGKVVATRGRAAMPIRGVRLFVHSEAVEREHSRDYWSALIGMLARNRFNRLNLVFAHQTSYLAPPYPLWVDVPQYPEIRAPGITAEQRNANLEMLRFISQAAAEHGIDFTLGIWEHNIQPGMKPSVEGITPENIGPYSYAALRAVLAACPGIRGVQMRTNSESGIPADQQVEFYRDWVFRALRDSGRLVSLEVRGWLMQNGLLDAALGAGVPLRLSSKYWAEDMGRPYQPAETWPNYSFLNFLERSTASQAEPETKPLPMLSLFPKTGPRARGYDFFWEVWGLGSHRLLLWGDPEFVKRSVRTFTLSDTQGFEIDPPLAQRGFGNTEAFGVFTPEQKQRTHWTHDFERYWMFYLLWGRLSYEPETSEGVWKAELARRFGPGAGPVLDAYKSASRILNEIVATHLADPNMYIWPEINPGGLIDAYMDVRPSDWSYVASVREAVRNRVQGRASAKQTPVQTASRLHAMARSVDTALAQGRAAIPSDHAEWLSTSVDFAVLSQLARYHARKMLAADGLAAFYEGGWDAGLYLARQQLRGATAAWKQIVAITDGVYPGGMSFAPDDKGHWKDKLPYVQHDLRLVDERLEVFEKFGLFDYGFDFGAPPQKSRGTSYRNDPYVLNNTVEPRFQPVGPDTIFDDKTGFGWVTGEGRRASARQPASYLTVRAVRPNPGDLPVGALLGDFIEGTGSHLFRVRTGAGQWSALLLKPDGEVTEHRLTAREGVVDVPLPDGDWRISGIILTRVDQVKAPAPQKWPEALPRPVFEHSPPVVSAGKPLILTLRVTPGARVSEVRLHYRPLNQLEKFRTLTASGGKASFTIAAEELSPRWDLQYYFEVLHDGHGGWFHPDPLETTPYFVVRIP